MSIEVKNINKTFGSFPALRDLNLEIETGELVALLGPSGSGKSTLLRIIAGLEIPDYGSPERTPRVLFNREPVDHTHVRNRGVGFVFQHYSLFRHMTVYENIAFGLRVRPRSTRPTRTEINERVRRLLELIQLESLAGRYPHQLSGGQRQRVALARALAVEPRVLLLDEPFGALDAKVRLELRKWLRRLHDEIHVTSVFVTHDQDEALEVADRVVIMNNGEIEQVGTPDEVFHSPKTRFVMEFIGTTNRFRGRYEERKAVFGSLILESAEPAGFPGREISGDLELFVRPHEIEILKTPNGLPAIRSRIRRIQPAGAVVRVELEDADGRSILVEVPHDRLDPDLVTVGQEVYLGMRRTRVFPA